jgi:addiction module HigA family antidote
MAMKNPPHMGSFIRTEIIEPHGLSVTAAAGVLGISRMALSNLLNEKAGLSAEMAIRLEKAFGVSRELLMRMQMNYELAQARQREDTIKVKRYHASGAGKVRAVV